MDTNLHDSRDGHIGHGADIIRGLLYSSVALTLYSIGEAEYLTRLFGLLIFIVEVIPFYHVERNDHFSYPLNLY